MGKYFILALVLVVFLSGCINPFGKKEYICPGGNFVSDPFFCFSDKKNITSVSNLTSEIDSNVNVSRGELQTIEDSWD